MILLLCYCATVLLCYCATVLLSYCATVLLRLTTLPLCVSKQIVSLCVSLLLFYVSHCLCFSFHSTYTAPLCLSLVIIVCITTAFLCLFLHLLALYVYPKYLFVFYCCSMSHTVFVTLQCPSVSFTGVSMCITMCTDFLCPWLSLLTLYVSHQYLYVFH